MSGGFVSCARALRAAMCAVITVVVVSVHAGAASADPAEAKKIFVQRCMACHTFGKGVKVGPDLKGVTERRERAWLLKFIRSSASVIDSGDAIAVELFQQFKQQRMPDWTDLSETQIGSVLDWLAINGPDQQDPDARPAEQATPADIAVGRQLFHGERKLVHAGSACASCHAIRDTAGRGGGTLASDLTGVYSQYQDTAMTLFLKHPCVVRYPESHATAFLAPEESFALKAYFRHTALTDQSARAARSGTPALAKAIDASQRDGAAPGSAAGKTESPTHVMWAPRAVGTDVHASRVSRIEGELLFLAFPYAALLVLIGGIAIRYAMTRHQRMELRAAASDAWRLFGGRSAWRIGIAATFALHLVGVVIPRSVVAWNGAPVRLYLLEGSSFLLGALALVGWSQIMRRHIARATASARATAQEIADCILLSLLCMAIVSGLATALLYRWGSSWSASTLAPYIASLARGAPQTQLIETMPFLVRLHVLSCFAVIAVVPFTSAALLVMPMLARGAAAIGRPIHAIARAGRRGLARLSPARWLWPEEDALDPSVTGLAGLTGVELQNVPKKTQAQNPAQEPG
jgi:nitrate reductase gamma subunit